ncbi:MAG TPA: NAD(P)-dependent alcohol dehydrogenase [Duganella sp.]|uniref:NAD(P)-dependent alcohol dehydrogenase n=1 Tax=Duganella sp. TaxID=1904440 RepID=UPI002ED498AB
MKRIQYDAYGGPHLMQLKDFQLAAPGPSEVAVRIKFTAINPIDWKVRNGNLKMVTGRKFPRAMGSDFSGIVIAVGAGVSRFKIGDAVFGMARLKESGALADAVITHETFLARKPDDISFEDAACFATPGVTAWNGLIDKAQLTAGKQVFINGCAGAVGEAAVQLAKLHGATVSGSCSANSMKRAGVHALKQIFNYQTFDAATIEDQFDIVYDTAGVMPTSVGLHLTNSDGVFLDIDPTPGKFIRAIFNRRLKPIVCSPRADILDGLAKAAANGKYRLPVGTIVPQEDAIRLLIDLEAGLKLNGKGLVAME